jgi:hypothetical protein
MKGLEDHNFWTEKTKGKFIGRVKEFPQLRTRAHAKAIDALDDIITQTVEHLRDLHEAQSRQATR